MTESSIDELIVSFLLKEIDGKDEEELRLWVGNSRENRAYFIQLCDLWQTSGACSKLNRFEALEAFKSFRRDHSSYFSTTKKKSRLKMVSYCAAAIASVVVAGVSYHLGKRQVISNFHEIAVEAPMGTSSRVVLPDGTVVLLNAESSLRYSQGFGVEDRHVVLSGEGYFEVQKDERLPFVVSTDNISVKVLGTKFDFRDYPEDLEAVVSLLEGRVSLTNKLRDDNRETYLNPDQRLILDKHSGNAHVESKDAENSVQWTSGNLFFDEELLTDIARELERRYDVKITIIGERLRKMRIYGFFASHDIGIYDIMDMLSSTNKLRYESHEGEIVICSKE